MMKTQRKYEGRISEKKGIGSILFLHGSVETECHIYIQSFLPKHSRASLSSHVAITET
jgi:hypothetical protein